MAISVAQAKSLCNATELALVKASTRTEIGQLSAAQLRQKIARARKLRDKWRDQAERQRRATQTAQRARQTDANARSAEKATLFAEVLGRFETQLTKLEAKGATGGSAPKRLAPRARSATHRATRAVVRDSLKEIKLGLRKPKKTSKPKAAPPAPVAATEPPANSETTSRKLTPPKPTRSKKAPAIRDKQATGAGMTALASAAAVQGLRVTKSKQRRAATAAKHNRLIASGIVRIQKNASSRNKRSQGKRDSR